MVEKIGARVKEKEPSLTKELLVLGGIYPAWVDVGLRLFYLKPLERAGIKIMMFDLGYLKEDANPEGTFREIHDWMMGRENVGVLAISSGAEVLRTLLGEYPDLRVRGKVGLVVNVAPCAVAYPWEGEAKKKGERLARESTTFGYMAWKQKVDWAREQKMGVRDSWWQEHAITYGNEVDEIVPIVSQRLDGVHLYSISVSSGRKTHVRTIKKILEERMGEIVDYFTKGICPLETKKTA